MAYLSKPTSEIINYAFSDSLEKLVVQSSENKIYTFMLKEFPKKIDLERLDTEINFDPQF